MAEQLEQTTLLLEAIAPPSEPVFVDLGYRGVAADHLGVEIIHSGISPVRSWSNGSTSNDARRLSENSDIDWYPFTGLRGRAILKLT